MDGYSIGRVTRLARRLYPLTDPDALSIQQRTYASYERAGRILGMSQQGRTKLKAEERAAYDQFKKDELDMLYGARSSDPDIRLAREVLARLKQEDGAPHTAEGALAGRMDDGFELKLILHGIKGAKR